MCGIFEAEGPGSGWLRIEVGLKIIDTFVQKIAPNRGLSTRL